MSNKTTLSTNNLIAQQWEYFLISQSLPLWVWKSKYEAQKERDVWSQDIYKKKKKKKSNLFKQVFILAEQG